MNSTPRSLSAALLIAIALLFLLANRAAYHGYFEDDELDNINWTRHLTAAEYLSGLVTPRYFPNNFRPAGHLYFGLLGSTAGLNFRPYVATLHALHLGSVCLLFFLLAGTPLPARVAAVLLFAFHAAAFDAYWKPMYVFDVLCGFFCLLSLFCWTRRRWVLSFLFFWLAYKSKEHAVMLPAALACYEYWLGERRWKPLLPFLAASLSFGLQGILANAGVGEAYRLSLVGLWKSISFYSSKVLLLPYLGLAFIPALLMRHPRLRFGLIFFLLLAVPMLLLPGRLYAVYLYVPLIGLAIAFAAFAEQRRPAVIALFLLLWLPANYLLLRQYRRATLTIAAENRSYVTTLLKAAHSLPDVRTFVYDGAPSAMNPWGIQGALGYAYDAAVRLYPAQEPHLLDRLGNAPFALLTWDPVARTLEVLSHPVGVARVPYVTMAGAVPFWLLEEGWLPREDHFRWTRPYARARLFRPEGASTFELTVNAGPPYIKAVGRGEVDVSLNGHPAGHAEFTETGWKTVCFPLAPAPPGPVTVEFRSRPEIRTPGERLPLGLPIGAFGFPATGNHPHPRENTK